MAEKLGLGLDDIMETDLAVNSILTENNVEIVTVEITSETDNSTPGVEQSTEHTPEITEQNKQEGRPNIKRPHSNNYSRSSSPDQKKVQIERLYNARHKGPYEVIIKDKITENSTPFK